MALPCLGVDVGEDKDGLETEKCRGGGGGGFSRGSGADPQSIIRADFSKTEQQCVGPSLFTMSHGCRSRQPKGVGGSYTIVAGLWGLIEHIITMFPANFRARSLAQGRWKVAGHLRHVSAAPPWRPQMPQPQPAALLASAATSAAFRGAQRTHFTLSQNAAQGWGEKEEGRGGA